MLFSDACNPRPELSVGWNRLAPKENFVCAAASKSCFMLMRLDAAYGFLPAGSSVRPRRQVQDIFHTASSRQISPRYPPCEPGRRYAKGGSVTAEADNSALSSIPEHFFDLYLSIDPEPSGSPLRNYRNTIKPLCIGIS
jgi:hypothetical protein